MAISAIGIGMNLSQVQWAPFSGSWAYDGSGMRGCGPRSHTSRDGGRKSREKWEERWRLFSVLSRTATIVPRQKLKMPQNVEYVDFTHFFCWCLLISTVAVLLYLFAPVLSQHAEPISPDCRRHCSAAEIYVRAGARKNNDAFKNA